MWSNLHFIIFIFKKIEQIKKVVLFALFFAWLKNHNLNRLKKSKKLIKIVKLVSFLAVTQVCDNREKFVIRPENFLLKMGSFLNFLLFFFGPDKKGFKF